VRGSGHIYFEEFETVKQLKEVTERFDEAIR
jgi:hypothetical protein